MGHHDKPKEKPFGWPPAATQMLRDYWAAGASASYVASRVSAEFGVAITRNAIIGKAGRLGLSRAPERLRRIRADSGLKSGKAMSGRRQHRPSKPAPIWTPKFIGPVTNATGDIRSPMPQEAADAPPMPAAAPTEVTPAKALVAAEPTRIPFTAITADAGAALAASKAAPPSNGGPIGIDDLTPRRCCWPVDPKTDDGWRYCGKPVDPAPPPRAVCKRYCAEHLQVSLPISKRAAFTHEATR